MTGESLAFLDGCTVHEGGTFAGPATTAAHEYWLQLSACHGDGMARVSDLNLMALYRVADRLVVKQVLDGGVEFRNRYWGTRVRDAFGSDATHKITADLVQGKRLAQILSLYRLAIAAPRPIRVIGEALFFESSNFHAFEAAYLPLYGESGAAERLLIAFDFDAA